MFSEVRGGFPHSCFTSTNSNRPAETESEEPERAGHDEEPGFLDMLAETEAALPSFSHILEEVTGVFTLLSDMANGAHVEMQQAGARGAGAGARLRIAEKMAREMNDPATRIEQLAADYVDQLARIEPGISYLVACIVENPNLLEEEDVREFVRSVRTLAREAEPALG